MSRWLCIFSQYIYHRYWWDASRFSKDTSLDVFHSSCISNILGVWRKTVRMGFIWPVCRSFWNMKINMESWSLWKVISRLQDVQMLCCLGVAHVQVIFVIWSFFEYHLYEKVERVQTHENGQRDWMERFGNKESCRKERFGDWKRSVWIEGTRSSPG